MKLNDRQKIIFAEKVLDLANIATGALVFGQFVSNQSFSWQIAGLGIILLFLLYSICYFVTQKGGAS